MVTLGLAVLAAGLLIGVSASSCLLPVAGLLILGEVIVHVLQRKSVLLASGSMILIAVACVAPWTVRNYHVLGGFIPIRSNFWP